MVGQLANKALQLTATPPQCFVVIEMKKNLILIISTLFLLLWINHFAGELGHLFKRIEDKYIFHVVYSAVYLLVSAVVFLIFSKLKKFHYKLFLCVVGALVTQIVSVAMLYWINFERLGDLGIIIGLGFGSVLQWVPVSIVWYFALKQFYKSSES